MKYRGVVTTNCQVIFVMKASCQQKFHKKICSNINFESVLDLSQGLILSNQHCPIKLAGDVISWAMPNPYHEPLS